MDDVLKNCKRIVADYTGQIGAVGALDQVDLFEKRINTAAATSLLLDDIVRQSYEECKNGSPQTVLDYFMGIKGCIPVEFGYLMDTVEAHLVRMVVDSTAVHETHIQKEFFDNLGKYLPGAIKVDVPVNLSHRPDGFVNYMGNILPVEVKLNSIVGSSIKQISRYMEIFESKGGVVVAPELKASLPSNVIFVQVVAATAWHGRTSCFSKASIGQKEFSHGQ